MAELTREFKEWAEAQGWLSYEGELLYPDVVCTDDGKQSGEAVFKAADGSFSLRISDSERLAQLAPVLGASCTVKTILVDE
jgi:hypothetical protein